MEENDPRLLREQLIYTLYLTGKPKKGFLEWFKKRVAEGDFGEEAREAYERGRRAGLEEAGARQILKELLVEQISRKFQEDKLSETELKASLDRIADPRTLKQLLFDLDRIADIDALRARLDELALENGSKEDHQTPQ